MTIEQLYYFVKIAESGSFTSASLKLFISQQALSISINNLEKELGVSLFQRSRKGVSLTVDGEYLYQQSKNLLSYYKKISEHFSTTLPLDGTVTIACNYRQKEYILSNTLSYFYARYPKVVFQFNLNERTEIISLVQKGEVDFGLLTTCYGKRFQNQISEDLTFIPLHEKKLACIVSNDSIYSKKNSSISINELKQHKIILERNQNYSEDIFYRIITHFNPEAQVIWADTHTLFHSLVKEGVGIGFTTVSSLNKNNTYTRSIPLKEKIIVSTGILLKKNVTPTEACKRTITHITENAENFHIIPLSV